LSGKPTMSNSG